MKKIEDILEIDDISTQEPTNDEPIVIGDEPTGEDDVVEPSTEESEEVAEDEIPEHIYTDPQIVGYPDEDTQFAIYDIALSGTIPITGYTKILDIGCGRGDLAKFIARRYTTLTFEYTGYELNQIQSFVANKVLLDDKFNVHNEDFLSADLTDQKFDQIYVIGSLNINYGWDNDWDHIELMMRKAIDVCSPTGSITFVLLHTNGGNDEYVSYAIPNMTDLILKFNLPFNIEYGEIEGVYKLTLYK